ncbi:alpha-L-arabinofuranosidase [Halopiger aswanensis]|uniref:Alpha-N-arabinofuranosidase n=1 Tax=Halopiger aswanensis TaxID=148449 RepID=A0A419W0C4_9EURY|nr:alpha-L-arabinofuranosidase [Halopiger aswanensis]RKD88933.1 alpha-N-arabinofuranosidase [Halopiger aswanensis]
MSPNPTADGSGDNDSDGGGLSRREVLATQSMLVAGSTVGFGAGIASAEPRETIENRVSVDPHDKSEEPVPDTLFGRLNEHYGDATIYPGVYSLHVMNPTFWRVPDYWFSDEIDAFYEVERHETLPFPWEPVDGSRASFDLRSDGERVAGGDSPHGTTGYPRIAVDEGTDGAGIKQRIVLPDNRTLGYDLGFSVRGDVDTVTASLTTLEGDVLASTAVDVSGEWTRYEPTLELDEKSGDEYVGGAVADVETPYGRYALEFTTDGTGHFDIDFVELAADDAVNGKFNPYTVDLLAEQHGTWLKWPGGNVTSQYNWRDGIGPLEERTPRFNHAWQGMQPNFFGTAEYLELCEVADLTPEITIGWWDNPDDWAEERQILPEDAADWVEYVNGSSDTEMGALRAEHGRADPWNVEHWGVGNEVWGDWQFGHTSDASEYATGSEERIGFDEYAAAMREVDDSITIIASGWDPAEAEHNDNPWNETLLDELSPEQLDGLNIHRYQWGLDSAEDVEAWKDDHDADDWDYSEVIVMAATQLGEQLGELGDLADEYGHEDDFYVNLSEIGIFPTVAEGAPYPGPETMPGASYVAGVLNACIRETDTVKWAAQTWVPIKSWVPVKTDDHPPDPNPLRPDGSVTGLYSAVFEYDAEWHAVDVETTGASRDLPDTGERINPMADVPYVDAAAMQNRRGEELALFLTNRNLRARSEVTIELGEWYADKSVEIVRLEPAADERPLPHETPTSWDEPTNHAVEHTIEDVDGDGTVTLELEPASIARLFVDNDRGRADIIGDNGVWPGLDGEENIPIRNNSGPGRTNGYGKKNGNKKKDRNGNEKKRGQSK